MHDHSTNSNMFAPNDSGRNGLKIFKEHISQEPEASCTPAVYPNRRLPHITIDQALA